MSQNFFDYPTAFSRTVGWITSKEQDILRSKRIAIAGMGGVGGSHLLSLTRLGIGKFNISDFDRFELPNFNRQVGASLAHLNQPKVDVLAAMALDINPTLTIKKFSAGVNADNLSEFFRDVDVYVDGLDFFAFEAREKVFAYCAEQGIPAVTVAPLGMSAALLNFLPGQMSFEDYFQLKGKAENDKILHFLVGLAPAMLQRGYLIDPSAVDFLNHKGPSTPMACELCAGVATTQVLKILLKRGNVLAAPWGLQFDAYGNKLAKTWRPGGNKNPLQRLALWLAKRQFIAITKK
jgi:molybdopterin/thiamine biosynthesis adenylyltransferase